MTVTVATKTFSNSNGVNSINGINDSSSISSDAP